MITDKQFWELCGLKNVEMRYGYWDACGDFCEMQSNPHSKHGEHHVETLCHLVEKNRHFEYWEAVPPVDLTNLFKYRPKNIIAIYIDFVLEVEEAHVHLIMADGRSYWAISDIGKPEDAVFEVIYKALGGE